MKRRKDSNRAKYSLIYPGPAGYQTMAYDFFNSFWKGFTGTNTIGVVAHRFIKAFRDHNIKAAQIPRLVPQLKLDDLKSEESLLVALTPDLLDHTAQLFGIRIEWLEGVDDEIYEYRNCYILFVLFFELLAVFCWRVFVVFLLFF